MARKQAGPSITESKKKFRKVLPAMLPMLSMSW